MSTLILWIDMLRPNLLEDAKPNSVEKRFLDWIENLGGVNYTNAYTSHPDTPRGMASFYTGKLGGTNGCDSRLKWPRHYLKKDLETIFDPVLKQGHKVFAFSNPNERHVGLFPDIHNQNFIHNDELNLKKFLKEIAINNKDMVFISIPDYHWALTDYSYLKYGHKVGLRKTLKTLEVISNEINLSNFDDIIIFSEHGFKLREEISRRQTYLLDKDRTNIFFYHKNKNITEYSHNYNLISLPDIGEHLRFSLNRLNASPLDFSNIKCDFILAEDYEVLDPDIFTMASLWAVITKDRIYHRSVSEAFSIEKDKPNTKIGIDASLDAKLLTIKSFQDSIQLYKNKETFEKRIYLKDNYIDGTNRHSVSHSVLLYHYILEKMGNIL